MTLLLAGFFGGVAFGWASLKTNLCVMGGITDIVLARDWRRFRAWLLAAAVALAATEALRLAGLVHLTGTLYLDAGFGWVAAAVGSVLFGLGMTLAGGCAHRNLVRLGAGSAKALAVMVVMTACAWLVLRGPLAPLHKELAALANPLLDAESQSLAALIAPQHESTARSALAFGLAAILLWICFKDDWFRRSRRDIAAGIAIGAFVAYGWTASSAFGTAPESFNFVLPLAAAGGPFAIAAVPGVVVGAFLSVAFPWRFRIERFAGRRDAAHNLVGAALMGTGGALALGCTIGQGVTGLSTLATSSFIAWAGLIAGALLGVRYLESSVR